MPPKKKRSVPAKKARRVATKKVRSAALKTATFRFKEGDPNVNRTVTIEIPPQGIRGDVKVIAALLPTSWPTEIPATKGGGKLIALALNPKVTIGRKEVYDFKPALKITISFTSEDADRAQKDPVTNQPRLKIVTLYDAKEGEGDWRWEKLPTDPDFKQGTLSAFISTLHPGDPEGVGSD